jgi:serine/threonine protein kinase
VSTAGTTTVQRGFTYKHGDRPLDGYTIQRAAGRGGFGEVYYAVSDSGREVALKLIQTYEQIELRGVSHCMNLKGPHLVTIFDVKYGADGRPWVIMEFVSGPSLRELLDAAPSGLGVQKSAFFLREIGKGLTYLHECGIVHRDLKPGNIFYENGYVKIGDYGLSKAISTSQYSGQTVTVGTVHYMAPEIGEGRYDKSIDIYALGALLFEMLTGQVPFFGASTTEVLMKHLSAQVDTSQIEEPFATVVRKAMAKNPADRYQSVQEMVEAIFGSEHVRNSVSAFSPESLTMVAGQVARKLPGNSSFSNSSGPVGPPPADPWNRFGQNIEQGVNRLNQAVAGHVQQVVGGKFDYLAQKLEAKRLRMEQRMAARRQKMEARWSRWQQKHCGWWGAQQQQQQGQSVRFQQQMQVQNPPSDLAADDPVSRGQRFSLSAVAITLVAIGTGVAAGRNGAEAGVFAGLLVLGATLGTIFGRNWIWPGLPQQPKLLGKLAIGGCATALAAIFSMPLAPAVDHQFAVQKVWLAVLICMFILDWVKRSAIDRPERVSIGKAIVGIIAGAIAGTICDDIGPLLAGVIGGTSLAVQIASPWSPAGAWRRKQRQQPGFPVLPMPPMPGMVAPAPVVPPIPVVPVAHGAAGAPSGGIDQPPQFQIPPVGAPAALNLPIIRLRSVPQAIRIVWVCFFMALATLGLCLWASMFSGAASSQEESGLLFGWGGVTLILAGLCLRRSFNQNFVNIWRYLFRPLLQVVCIGSIVLTISMLTIGGLRMSDTPPAVFFIIFPTILFLVITFFIPRGEGMQAVHYAAGSGVPQQSEGFFLGRMIAGAGRFVFTIVAFALLAVAVAAAIGVAADLPGLFNSHLVDPQIRADAQQTFGHSDWPRLIRTLGALGSFVIAIIAITILLQARRRYGPIHMFRAVAGAALLFAAILALSHALPAWSDLVRTNNGWEFLDEYLQQTNTHRLFGAAFPAALALVMLLWPGERKRTPRFAVIKEEVVR